MKSLLTTLMLLTIVSAPLYANVEALKLENFSEEEILDFKENEIEKLNLEDSQKKKSLLQKIRTAKKGFREWKLRNPNHKEIRNEFKKISKKIKTKGTPENMALVKSIESCKENQSQCNAILESNLMAIYNNSEIPYMAQADKQNFSIINKAHASALSFKQCLTYNSYPSDDYFIGLFGKSTACNLSFIGPGLGYITAPYHAQICVGSGEGVNVGVYASATAIFGAGFGLTVGEGGVCQIVTLNVVGLSAFAGIVISEDFAD